MKPLPQSIYDAHANLVHHCAIRCITRFGAPADFKDDLVQEGCLGLIRAWQTFDPNKGKFSTYAHPWITLYQSRFVRENMSIVRPTRYNAGLTRGQVVALTKRDLSMDAPIEGVDDKVIGDVFPDLGESADRILEREELRALVRDVAYSFAWTEPELLVLEGRLLAWPEDRVKNREMAERFGQATSTSRMREARMMRMIGERIVKMMEGTG